VSIVVSGAMKYILVLLSLTLHFSILFLIYIHEWQGCVEV